MSRHLSYATAGGDYGVFGKRVEARFDYVSHHGAQNVETCAAARRAALQLRVHPL